MNKEIGKAVLLGSTAAAAGTALLRGMMAMTQRVAPETLPPTKEDPGHFMARQIERSLPPKVRHRLPGRTRSILAMALAFGYGITWGSLYAALRPRGGKVLQEGTTLGAAVWAAGSLGWLPGTHLAPPVWKQAPKQVLSNFFSHVIFGVTTVALFKWAAKKSA
jgi:hypothetical protein